MIRRALVVEGVGLSYAVRLVRRDLLKPCYRHWIRCVHSTFPMQVWKYCQNAVCDVIFLDNIPIEWVKRIQAGELTIALGMSQWLI